MTQEALRRMAVNAADALELSDREKKALDIDDIVKTLTDCTEKYANIDGAIRQIGEHFNLYFFFGLDVRLSEYVKDLVCFAVLTSLRAERKGENKLPFGAIHFPDTMPGSVSPYAMDAWSTHLRNMRYDDKIMPLCEIERQHYAPQKTAQGRNLFQRTIKYMAAERRKLFRNDAENIFHGSALMTYWDMERRCRQTVLAEMTGDRHGVHVLFRIEIREKGVTQYVCRSFYRFKRLPYHKISAINRAPGLPAIIRSHASTKGADLVKTGLRMNMPLPEKYKKFIRPIYGFSPKLGDYKPDKIGTGKCLFQRICFDAVIESDKEGFFDAEDTFIASYEIDNETEEKETLFQLTTEAFGCPDGKGGYYLFFRFYRLDRKQNEARLWQLWHKGKHAKRFHQLRPPFYPLTVL